MTPEARRQYYQTRRREERDEGKRRVSVTLSAAEYGRVSRDATLHRTTPTAHLKALAFSALDQQYLVPPDQAERLDALIAILRGVGNNLNQLARHANEMRAFMDTDQVRLQLRRMEDAITAHVSSPPVVGAEVAADVAEAGVGPDRGHDGRPG